MLLLALATCSPLLARPLTVDDVLGMADIGRVEFSPDERSLFYEWIAPYEHAPNLYTLYQQADRSALAQVRRVDLISGEAPQPAFEQDARGGYWLGGFSADGRWLAVYRLLDDRVRAGVLEVATGQVRFFDFTPNYFWMVQRAVWISNEELVYPTLPAGEQPSIIFRSGIAARIQAKWRLAFEGKESSGTNLRSTVDGLAAADEFRAGTLVRVNARTGEVRPISEGYYYGFRLSADGRYLAAMREAGVIQPLADEPPDPDAARRQLVIFDLWDHERETKPCEACNVVRSSLQWSPDGSRLLFFAVALDGEPRSGRWYVHDRAEGKTKVLRLPGMQIACDAYGRPKPGVAVMAGNRVAVQGFPTSTAQEAAPIGNCATDPRKDWYLIDVNGGEPVPATTGMQLTERHNPVAVAADGVLLLADGALWRVAMDGRRRLVHRSSHGAMSIWQSTLASEQETYLQSERAISRAVLETAATLVVVDVASSRVVELRKPQGGSVVALASRGRVFAVRIDGDEGSRLAVVDGGKPRTILAFNNHLAAVRSAQTATLRYSVDGVPLTSCVLIPSNVPARRLPMVVNIYPQAQGSCPGFGKARFYPYNLQLLAAQGYAVLFPDVAGARTASRGAGAADELVKLALAAVDAAVAAGYADPQRLGLWGLSQGYNSALRLLTESARFKAAVLQNGVANFVSHYGSMPLYSRFGADSLGVGNAARYENPASPNWIGAAPWQNPEAYVRHNPFFRVDRIQSPVLIMHSDFDQFALGQSEELFAALYRMRKPATFVTYWGEGHGNLSPANIRDAWRRIIGWFERYLAPAARPIS
ncbi:MAG: S9 family peptidase [Gammaproteobacteria bacterium]|nr:S9 family peptidase [Gammaproteobacteria bacterium]